MKVSYHHKLHELPLFLIDSIVSAFTVDFGHVRIPDQINVPPSLKMLGISPQVNTKRQANRIVVKRRRG